MNCTVVCLASTNAANIENMVLFFLLCGINLGPSAYLPLHKEFCFFCSLGIDWLDTEF